MKSKLSWEDVHHHVECLAMTITVLFSIENVDWSMPERNRASRIVYRPAIEHAVTDKFDSIESFELGLTYLPYFAFRQLI